MLSCPICSTDNEAGALFCDQCGASLTPMNDTGNAAEHFGAGIVAPTAAPNTCGVCGAAAVAGDAFCNECGAALGAPLPTAGQVGIAQAPPAPSAAPAAARIPVSSGAAPAAHAQILLGNGQNVELGGRESYLIGREDPISGIYPEIDTSASDGDTSGVSRRHAEIVRQSNQWFLQDLNSTNGTFVNNQRLAPHTRHPLRSGDQIRLGKWIATFQVN